jgi:hypothetical protein
VRFKILVFSMVVTSTTPLLYAQATGGTGSPSGAKTVPVNVLYWAFFGHVARLDTTAAALQKSATAGAVGATINPANLRAYYKRRLSLTDSEDAALHNVAAVFDAAVKQQDDAAKAVIKDLRAQLRSAKSSAGTPEVPQQLVQMQTQRDAIISSYINMLKTQMGAPGFQKVDNFVNTAFAVHASAQTIDPAARANAMTRLSKVDLKGRKGSAAPKPPGAGRGVPVPEH